MTWAAAAAVAAARTPADGSTPPALTADLLLSERERLAQRERELGQLHPETIAAAEQLGLALIAAGDEADAIALLRGLVQTAVAELGDESEVTGVAQCALAVVLQRAGAPAADQLGCLTEAIKALSASVGPSHPHTTATFGRLAVVALDGGAVEVAVTAGMQALGGLSTRGEEDTAEAGGIHATLAMAAAARRSPAAMGAAERAHSLTAGCDGSDPNRRRAVAAWRALGSPRRHAVTGELSVIAFGSPPSLVVELTRTAADGAADQHDQGMRPEAARAFRAAIAAAPFAWSASAGGFEAASRSGDAAVLRFTAAHDRERAVEVLLDAGGLAALRGAVDEALTGTGVASQPARNDPCPCGSGAKYKRCCGR